MDDRSEGWDGIAGQFLAARSATGTALVRSWAQRAVPRAGSIVDIGCGSGVPIAEVLIADGFHVSGIDASPKLLEAFRRRFPDAPSACEAAQDSGFFDRSFDAAVAIGLVFLLSAADQRALLPRAAHALNPGGRLLFSAPRETCEWNDLLTGRQSRSLGEPAYAALLEASGLRLIAQHHDEGGNHYYDAARPG